MNSPVINKRRFLSIWLRKSALMELFPLGWYESHDYRVIDKNWSSAVPRFGLSCFAHARPRVVSRIRECYVPFSVRRLRNALAAFDRKGSTWVHTNGD